MSESQTLLPPLFLLMILVFLKLRYFPGNQEGFTTVREPSWAILQFDDRPLSPTFEKLQSKVKTYCQYHGYEHIFIKESSDIPPYWQKVKLAQDILNRNQHKGVLWLDTDAVIHDIHRPLDSFLVDGKHFYYSPDSPKWSSNFNAGVWLVLATENGKNIVQDWMSEYNEKAWKKEKGGWKSNGIWAGETYEQGSFSNKILPKYKESMQELPWQVFQSDTPQDTSFTLHFAGGEKEPRIHKYFSSFYG